jgi:hypothetical protein
VNLQLQFIIVPLVALVLAFVAVTLLLRYFKTREVEYRHGNLVSYTKDGLGVAGVFVSVFAGIAILVTAVLLIPFNPKYWVYEHVDGTVASVSNRFVSGTGDLSSDYVLRIDGQPGVFNVQDNRIQGVKIGDPVDLTCAVQWVYAGQDQNNCFIRSWGGAE